MMITRAKVSTNVYGAKVTQLLGIYDIASCCIDVTAVL